MGRKPFRTTDEKVAVVLIDRLHDRVAYPEGMASGLPERRDDKAVRLADHKRRLV